MSSFNSTPNTPQLTHPLIGCTNPTHVSRYLTLLITSRCNTGRLNIIYNKSTALAAAGSHSRSCRKSFHRRRKCTQTRCVLSVNRTADISRHGSHSTGKHAAQMLLEATELFLIDRTLAGRCVCSRWD
uniref:(northern house mosquito) hypothetical protein n=1 Tax=Culex pipiens TaxID=7175 RepID=A0A8D8FE22_CULPI